MMTTYMEKPLYIVIFVVAAPNFNIKEKLSISRYVHKCRKSPNFNITEKLSISRYVHKCRK